MYSIGFVVLAGPIYFVLNMHRLHVTFHQVQRHWQYRVKQLVPQFFQTLKVALQVYLVYTVLYVSALQFFSTSSTYSLVFNYKYAVQHVLFLARITAYWEVVQSVASVFDGLPTAASQPLNELITPISVSVAQSNDKSNAKTASITPSVKSINYDLVRNAHASTFLTTTFSLPYTLDRSLERKYLITTISHRRGRV
jgi:hypothetical protein